MTTLVYILSYLIGSIPFALIIGKFFYKTDIRQHGSGNLGGTNTFRVLGKKAGILVSLGDVLKGTLAAALPLLLELEANPLLVGIAAIIGHCYPIFAGFRGGKAVATTAGVFLFVQPIALFVGLLCFIAVLKASKFVSLSSICAALGIVTFSLFQTDNLILYISIALAVFISFKHRKNIERIINKSEPKVKWI